MFGEAEFLVYVKGVMWCKQVCTNVLKVSHHTISPVLEIDLLLLPGIFRSVPVNPTVNTLENIWVPRKLYLLHFTRKQMSSLLLIVYPW